MQGQKIERHADNALRFLHHLRLGNPQCRTRHRYGKIVDFNAIELPDVNTDRIEKITQHSLPAIQQADDAVLQATQAQVGLGQEISGPTSRVEESQ